MILMDTNVLIYALANKEPYVSWFKKELRRKNLAISVIGVAEFLSGAMDSEARALEILLDKMTVVGINLEIAREAADYRKKYLRLKRKVLLPDCLIAACCKVYEMKLATCDRSDYLMKDINYIKLE